MVAGTVVTSAANGVNPAGSFWPDLRAFACRSGFVFAGVAKRVCGVLAPINGWKYTLALIRGSSPPGRGGNFVAILEIRFPRDSIQRWLAVGFARFGVDLQAAEADVRYRAH